MRLHFGRARGFAAAILGPIEVWANLYPIEGTIWLGDRAIRLRARPATFRPHPAPDLFGARGGSSPAERGAGIPVSAPSPGAAIARRSGRNIDNLMPCGHFCHHVRRALNVTLNRWCCEDCGFVGGMAGMSQIVCSGSGA